MFAPENFYYILRDRYGTYPDQVLMTPGKNGEKDLIHFFHYLDGDRCTMHKSQNLYARSQSTQIWMYDQEPIFPSAVDTYKSLFYDTQDPANHEYIREMNFAKLFSSHIATSSFSIWCTSEISPEIQTLESFHFISCYYWYHAFISRDWYRHWQFSKSLDDRSFDQYQFRFLLYARDFSGTRSYRSQLVDQLKLFQSDVLYDWDQRRQISSDHSAKIDLEHALTSRIHLVAETLFDTSKLYLTEKILKPIVMNQPFIVWGPPGSLAYLKRYGFRTFESCWSEEYDLVQDADRRMSMLIDLVKSLAEMDTAQFQSLMSRCELIVRYNRSHFYSSDFMDFCWKELQESFENAFEKRNYLKERYPWGQTCEIIGSNPDLLRIQSRKAVAQQFSRAMDKELRIQLNKQHPCFADL